MLYQRMASSMSLDDFIRNPSLDYGQQYSGALITQQVASAAANIAKEARGSEEGRRRLRKILPYQYELVQQNGFSREAVMKAILDSPDADKILTGLVEDAISSSGVKEWGDDATQRRAYDYARKGLYSAIGQTSYQMVTDQAGLTQLQYDLQDRNNRRAEARAAARKRQEQEDAEYEDIKASAQSFLDADGTLSKYTTALSGLKAGQNSVKASIFGKNGNVNPLVVYDRAQAAMSTAERRIRQSYEGRIRSAEGRAAYEVGDYGPDNDEVKRLKSQMASAISTARSQAYSQTLQSYGVSQGITKDQYDALRAVGYNGSAPMLDYNTQIATPLNALGKRKSYYSTNMSNYEIPSEVIGEQLAYWDETGSFSNRVHVLNANGTQGKAVGYGDLKDKKVTGVFYSALTPKKIIVQFEGGKRYLVDPNVLGSETYDYLSAIESGLQLEGADLTDAAITGTRYLIKRLNYYNQTAPKTSAGAAPE